MQNKDSCSCACDNGKYVIIKVGDPHADEWTNVGVMFYTFQGDLIETTFDALDRAKMRHDVDNVELMLEAIHSLPSRYPKLEDVGCYIRSREHSQSNVQLTYPQLSAVDSWNRRRIFAQYCHRNMDQCCLDFGWE